MALHFDTEQSSDTEQYSDAMQYPDTAENPDTAQHPCTAEGKRKYYTYMVRCSDGSYYTGYTTDLEKRVACHNAGTGAKYTKSRRPVRLIYSEAYESKHDAMSREAKIKQLTHREKEKLITDSVTSAVNNVPDR